MVDKRSVKNASNATELAGLTEQYPYCSTLRVLHGIAAREEDTIDQKQILNTASVYIKDRSKLYEYIVKAPLLKTLEDAEIETEKEAAESPDPELAKTAEAVETSRPMPEEIAGLKEKDKLENPGISHRPLEEEIMREAMTHIGEMETGYALGQLDQKEGEANETLKKDEEPPAPTSFGTWLKRFDSEKVEQKNENRDLIDRFIEDSPQISPVKTAFFSPSQMGKMSLVDNESFVTETLAKIYAKQGDYKKAAQAYKNLGLKYPEKRIYFAALQKEAEKNLKK
ncbi:MAG: hypothetical protein ABR574_02410 [Cryomorphaceae bacterium]|nr:hypothetical protein [Flavobacteriales bacterium]